MSQTSQHKPESSSITNTSHLTQLFSAFDTFSSDLPPLLVSCDCDAFNFDSLFLCCPSGSFSFVFFQIPPPPFISLLLSIFPPDQNFLILFYLRFVFVEELHKDLISFSEILLKYRSSGRAHQYHV